MNTPWSLGSFQFGRHPFAGWSIGTDIAADVAEALAEAFLPETRGGGRVYPFTAFALARMFDPEIETRFTNYHTVWRLDGSYTTKQWDGSQWVTFSPLRIGPYSVEGQWVTEKQWDGTTWTESPVVTSPPTTTTGQWAVRRVWNGTEWVLLGQEWVA
jgi:hypothetical protein